MADYRKPYDRIRATGANVAAISVDAPEPSETMRREQRLPCDTDRRVIRDWGIYNARERGGIAKPALFLIDRDPTVRYLSVDSIAVRAPAAEIVRLLNSLAPSQAARKVYMPTPTDFFGAIRNGVRGKRREPKPTAG